MTIIADSLQAIQTNIARAQCAAKRVDPIKLLAVSKSQSAEKIRQAYLSGQHFFGENYVQEAIDKQSDLKDLDIEWHFIGPIQSNKTQLIAQHFSWVHSVDRLKIATRLNDSRPQELGLLNVCLQINSSDEASKSGANLDEVLNLAHAIKSMQNLKLRGLMAIPAPVKELADQRAQFKIVHDAFKQMIANGFALDTLSIGMSDDYIAAIYEGATIVRIGSALFGARPNNKDLN